MDLRQYFSLERMGRGPAAMGAILGTSTLLYTFKCWMQGPKCTSNARLDGKTVVVTGANTGIGKICARELSNRGAKVVMLCRSVERGEAAAREIREITRGEVIVQQMDLASLASIREAANHLLTSLDRVDILLNNAGIMACPLLRTEDGFEMQLGTNHLGHFLLTNLLLPLIQGAAPGARIVNVSSLAHTRGRMYWEDLNFEQPGSYEPFKAYQQSKLANVLFSKELAKRVGGENGVHVYSLHPGVIATELGRNLKDSYGVVGGFLLGLISPLIKTPESGAQTSLYCCLEESIASDTGKYYSDCREKPVAPLAKSAEDAERLWQISEKLTGLQSK